MAGHDGGKRGMKPSKRQCYGGFSSIRGAQLRYNELVRIVQSSVSLDIGLRLERQEMCLDWD